MNYSFLRPNYLGSENWNLQNTDMINIIFGRNGSGKSILLRNFRDQDKNTRHYVPPERGGNIKFELSYLLEEGNSSTRGKRRKSNFVNSFHQEAVTRLETVISKIGERAGRGKETPLLIPTMTELLSLVVPDFDVELYPKERNAQNNPYILKRLGGLSVEDISALSSGEVQMFTLALDVLTVAVLWKIEKVDDGIILIDEPDVHLHPDLQQTLSFFLVRLIEIFGVKLFIATHSTTLMAALGYHGSSTRVCFLDTSEANVNFELLKVKEKELINVLGGHALIGALFSHPMLLVEGPDDYLVWGQVPRHGIITLSVVPCEGNTIKSQQKFLENIFTSMHNKPQELGYALLDNDISKPSTSSHKQDYVPFIQIACHEIENLYLTDNVLQKLGYNTWEEAKCKIKKEANNYGEKKELLHSCDSWDRKNVDIKHLINEIARILDNQNLSWTLRLGKIIGDAKPNGMLADFLGKEVVSKLWPNNA
jgi:predicted ATP-dependent endonuclease of OLD family